MPPPTPPPTDQSPTHPITPRQSPIPSPLSQPHQSRLPLTLSAPAHVPLPSPFSPRPASGLGPPDPTAHPSGATPPTPGSSPPQLSPARPRARPTPLARARELDGTLELGAFCLSVSVSWKARGGEVGSGLGAAGGGWVGERRRREARPGAKAERVAVRLSRGVVPDALLRRLHSRFDYKSSRKCVPVSRASTGLAGWRLCRPRWSVERRAGRLQTRKRISQ